jgi:hypothetical protein
LQKELSGLDNFKNVSVSGQPSSAYPSEFTDFRVATIPKAAGFYSSDTYFVAGQTGQGLGALGFGDRPAAGHMKTYKNRQIQSEKAYGPGRRLRK